jgi:hypothetical protein
MEWKKPLLIGIGWGAGTAVGLALIVGGFLLYQSRPKPPQPPKPWNVSAIKAEYDTTDTEGVKNTVVFYYTLENMTDFDYRIENADHVLMSATLLKQKHLSPFDQNQTIDYPIFVPARKRMRFLIHINYPCPFKEKPNADLEERRHHRRDVEKYASDEFGNLDGFDLLDEDNRYEIVFPPGWKQQLQQQEPKS